MRDKARILLLYREMIPSIRLCGHVQMEQLAMDGVIEYNYCQEMKLTSRLCNWADIVILGRFDSRYEYDVVHLLHCAGKYLIYILDDDLLNIPQGLSNNTTYYSQEEVRNNIQRVLALCDAIISPSERIFSKYARPNQKRIKVEEPALLPVEYVSHKNRETIKIGFAGSLDRTGDVENILEAALIKIKKEYGEKVELEFFGVKPKWNHCFKYSYIPYEDSYENYRNKMNYLQWDIGLAPMPDSPFHACKHYNKFVEYSAAGIAGIYSNVLPYSELLTKGKIGLFCRNETEEWYRTLKDLIENTGVREEIRYNVCKYSKEFLSCSSVTNALRIEMQEVLGYRAAPYQLLYCIGLKKIKYILWKLYILIRLRRTKTITIILKKIFKKNN